jgi:hypothetical protein
VASSEAVPLDPSVHGPFIPAPGDLLGTFHLLLPLFIQQHSKAAVTTSISQIGKLNLGFNPSSPPVISWKPKIPKEIAGSKRIF